MQSRISLTQAGRIFGWTGTDKSVRRNAYRVFCSTQDDRHRLQYSTHTGRGTVDYDEFMRAMTLKVAQRLADDCSPARRFKQYSEKGAPPPNMRPRFAKSRKAKRKPRSAS